MIFECLKIATPFDVKRHSFVCFKARVALLPVSFDNIIFLKSNKGGYYSGKIADVEENIEDDCDEPILISAFKKLLQVSMSNKEPLLNTTKENK